MRVALAWVVARKDFSEYRANRQILLTLTLFPLLMAVVLPLVLTAPFLLLGPPNTGPPPDIGLGTLTSLAAGNFTATTLVDVDLRGGYVSSSVITGSRVGNATLVAVVVEHSFLENVTLNGGVVRDSVIVNSTLSGGVQLDNTVVVGEDEEHARLREAFGAVALNLPLLFFLMMSVAVPTTLAAYAIVGEKAGRSLEPLLAAPVTDGELLLGKYLASLVPTVAVLLGSWGIFTVLADLTTVPALGVAPLPNLTWAVGLLVVMPLMAFLGIATNVLISTKVSDVRTAQQYAALLVLPVTFLITLGASGGLILGPGILLAFGGVLGAIDLGLFVLNVKVFHREEILTKWK